MGKSRGGAAKAGSVFRIARSGVLRAKAKGKARPVTSGLKQVSAAAGGGASRAGAAPHHGEGPGPAAAPEGGLGPAGFPPLRPRCSAEEALGTD